MKAVTAELCEIDARSYHNRHHVGAGPTALGVPFLGSRQRVRPAEPHISKGVIVGRANWPFAVRADRIVLDDNFSQGNSFLGSTPISRSWSHPRSCRQRSTNRLYRGSRKPGSR